MWFHLLAGHRRQLCVYRFQRRPSPEHTRDPTWQRSRCPGEATNRGGGGVPGAQTVREGGATAAPQHHLHRGGADSRRLCWDLRATIPSRSSRPLVHSCARTEMLLIFGTLPGVLLSGVLEAGRSPQGGAWAQCPRGGPIPCKCSSCAGQSPGPAKLGVGPAGDRASSLPLPGTGHSCQARRRAPWRAWASTARGPCPPAGAARLSSHPGARSRGGATEHRAQARPPHVLGACPSRPTGVPHELLEPTSEALPGAADSSAPGPCSPPSPGSVFTLRGPLPIPAAPCARARHRTLGVHGPSDPESRPVPRSRGGWGATGAGAS